MARTPAQIRAHKKYEEEKRKPTPRYTLRLSREQEAAILADLRPGETVPARLKRAFFGDPPETL